MRCLRFADRFPRPKTVFIGMEGEHNAETIKISGLPDFGPDQIVIMNVVMPDGVSIDLLSISDNQVTITRDITSQPGALTAWVTIQVGTDIVWKSETFSLELSDLPDATEMIEHQYPTALEEVLNLSTQNAQRAEDAADESEMWAGRSEMCAHESGYIDIRIDEIGHLIYTRTPAVAYDFEIDSEGHLILELI